MAPIFPDFETPSPSDVSVLAFAREINSEQIVVSVKVAERTKPIGNCYWNAARVANERGGTTQLGWLFLQWDDFYIEAMHHAVWKMPSGRLIDVTEKYPVDSIRNRSTFLPDDSVSIDLHRLPNITSRQYLLRDSMRIRNVVDSYRKKNALEKQYAQLLWDIGYRASQQFALAAGEEPTAPDIKVTDTAVQMINRLISDIATAKDALGAAIIDLKRYGAG